jgi:pyruvate dehydrogenase E2 component (dihydrolipoamide acetyltransferase)
MRKTIARRMCVGVHEAAPVTLVVAVDATRLASLRREFKVASSSGDGFVPSITDLLVKLAAQSLVEHPQLNAQWHVEGILHPEEIHIGVAVDTEAGLLVPVVRNVCNLSLRDVSQEIRRLADGARARRLKADDLEGGTFTISNLGMFGVDAFTPILHSPQAAILGVGRIVREPAVVDDRIEPREKMTLSLTFDHRIVDGAPAARFLDSLHRRIEQPSAHLLS